MINDKVTNIWYVRFVQYGSAWICVRRHLLGRSQYEVYDDAVREKIDEREENNIWHYQ